jgi:RNA polymerase sigma-70 factor (ECF subfamily)
MILPGKSYDIEVLLREVGKGNEQAFEAVFDHYKAPFHSAAFKMTRSANISEEIVQEVFITLWVKRELVARAKRPEGYVFTILHNCIYFHFRKLARERQLKSKLVQEESENKIEELLNEKENKAILEKMINHLPPQQKLVYRLAKQEGLSRAEIAKELNISPNTVKSHLGSAIEYLRWYVKKSSSALIWVSVWMHL